MRVSMRIQVFSYRKIHRYLFIIPRAIRCVRRAEYYRALNICPHVLSGSPFIRNNNLDYQPFRRFLLTLLSLFLSSFLSHTNNRAEPLIRELCKLHSNACSSANSGSIKCNWRKRPSNWVQGNNKFEDLNLTG